MVLFKVECRGVCSHYVRRKKECVEVRELARIKPEELQKCFMGWMQAVQTVTEGELLNVDGKTLRGGKRSWEFSQSDSHGECVVSFTQLWKPDMGGWKLVAIGRWAIRNICLVPRTG